MRLTYSQTWEMKEKEKERIYGFQKITTKFFLECVRESSKQIQETIVELKHSSDGNFQHLFIATLVSKIKLTLIM